MRVGVMTHIGQVRAVNQDAYLMRDSLVAVADGMGGHQAGEVASRLAIDVLEDWSFDREHPNTSLHQALAKANMRVFEMAEENPNMTGMGTTLSLAWFLDDTVHIAHIGDSRVYQLRKGELRQITWDHSVVGELVRSGALDEEEALRHPHRNVLTRSLGTSPIAEFDLHEISLRDTEGLLLCTDGLYSLVSHQELAATIQEIEDPQLAVEQLVALANERGGHDNITALLVLP
ncbi:MAG: Stp1/IreP family PP2C-type Ser/Thr phosphatase [Firmicutes bacterium]|nr:Stp1/IreP family PP2C-type Ser/Thr phosphatase [Bacillota bacterium]